MAGRKSKASASAPATDGHRLIRLTQSLFDSTTGTRYEAGKYYFVPAALAEGWVGIGGGVIVDKVKIPAVHDAAGNVIDWPLDCETASAETD